MLKQIKISSLLISIITMFTIVGCGDIIETVENRPTPPVDVISLENKARYVDSNVSGIEYISRFGCEYDTNGVSKEVCDKTIEGNTSTDGTFGFIPGGDGVKFYVAGLLLDYVEPKYLVNNAVITVLETNSKLASFLQSMDNDGNAGNGINIVPEVVQALYDLNVSKYIHVNAIELNIETLVQEVQAKLDGESFVGDSATDKISPSTTSPSARTVEDKVKKFQKSTVATLRYVNESEALEHLSLTISKNKPLVSTTVTKVVDDIKELFDNAQNLSEEEIQEKIKAIRAQLDNPLENDRGLVDIEIAQALLDLSELTNQPYLEDVLTFKGDTVSKLSQLIKDSALENGQNLVVSKEENSTNVINVSRKATIGVVTNLVTISKKLGASLASVPQHYKFEYEGFSLTIDNITTLRATLLAIASEMTLSTAYHAGKDEDYIPKTYTDVNGSTYQYQDVNIRMNELLNNEGYGIANDQVALSSAKQYLLQSALLLKDLSASSIKKDMNESILNTSEEVSDNAELIDYASKLYKVLSDGNGAFTTSSTNSDGTKEELTFDLNRIFKLETTLKPSDFGTNWKYACETGLRIATEEEAKIHNELLCYNEFGYINYSADLNATTQPESETSSLDELITKITIDDSVEKTGQELIDYILDTNGGSSSSSTPPTTFNPSTTVQPKFTYEKLAGKTFYSVAENGDDAELQIFAPLGINTLQTKPLHIGTLSNPISFRIENGELIINDSSGSETGRIVDSILSENVNGKYDRYNYKFYLSATLSENINYRAYYNSTDADAYLGELRNFKYIGSDSNILIAPNGGEQVTSSDSSVITWNSGQITSSFVEMYVLVDDPSNLYQFQASASTMLSNKSWVQLNEGVSISNSGQYQPTFSEKSGLNGNAYIILITSEDGSQWDISNSTFSINYVGDS